MKRNDQDLSCKDPPGAELRREVEYSIACFGTLHLGLPGDSETENVTREALRLIDDLQSCLPRFAQRSKKKFPLEPVLADLRELHNTLRAPIRDPGAEKTLHLRAREQLLPLLLLLDDQWDPRRC